MFIAENKQFYLAIRYYQFNITKLIDAKIHCMVADVILQRTTSNNDSLEHISTFPVPNVLKFLFLFWSLLCRALSLSTNLFKKLTTNFLFFYKSKIL